MAQVAIIVDEKPRPCLLPIFVRMFSQPPPSGADMKNAWRKADFCASRHPLGLFAAGVLSSLKGLEATALPG
jgi:hypothetical protein